MVHAAQHLHGGVGVDLTYPLHRYFLWAKQIELNRLGHVEQQYEVEDLATGFIRLEGGATLLLEASWATHSGASDDFGVYTRKIRHLFDAKGWLD